VEKNLSYAQMRAAEIVSAVQFFWRQATAKQFLAFLGVGFLNTGFGYSVFAVLYFLGFPHRIAIIIATAVGVSFNYLTVAGLVFDGSGPRLFLRFVIAYAFTCAINVGLVDAMVSRGVEALVAQALALMVVVPLTFFINKWYVFRRRP
jgi:putative flippase GtrA